MKSSKMEKAKERERAAAAKKMKDPLNGDISPAKRSPLPNQTSESVLKEMISALHRASMSKVPNVRQASIASLEIVAVEHPLFVLQTWLDQFARTNGGSSPAEYSAPSRVYLLQGLRKVVDKIVERKFLDDDNVAMGACVGRIISMATEEITKHPDVIPDIQKHCSYILVQIGENKAMTRVMDAVLLKFQPSPLPHFYVVQTLSDLSAKNPIGFVPFLKAILGTMTANMKSIKKENLKFAYASALANFSEAITDYLVNLDKSPDPSVTKEHFLPEIDVAHDIIFNSWLSSKDGKVKNSVLDALGKMAPLITHERLCKQVQPILNTLISTYKKVQDPFYVTQCICLVIGQAAKTDPSLIEPIIEPLLTALFTQMCSQNSLTADYSKPLAMKNNHEVLRCYDILIKSHSQKLLQGLIVRMGSVDENIRLAALKALKHILNSSLELFKDKMPDVVKTLHSKLALETSVKVKKMLAELIALLGRLGYLEEGREGKDFLDFILRQCSLPNNLKNEDDYSLKKMCANILQLLASSVPSLEPLLWPRLMDYLLSGDFSNAVTPITKSLLQIVLRKKDCEETLTNVDYDSFQNITGPYDLFARMIVLAAVPYPDARGTHVLSFIQNFAANINKHLPALWKQRIPLLQHYLETHFVPETEALKATWDQSQWEEWLLTFVNDTLVEVDLEEWNTALAKGMMQQLSTLYNIHTSTNNPCSSADTFLKERCFLIKCIGVVLKRSSNRVLIMETLGNLFLEVNHHEKDQQRACATAFGICAERHLTVAMDKLEIILKTGWQKRHNSIFGFLRDHKADEEQNSIRMCIVIAVGQIALKANKTELKSKCDEIISKFISPALKSNNIPLKLTALQSVAEIAKAIQSAAPTIEIVLVHHGDLIHEAIECMKDEHWELEGKVVALTTTLELIRCPPFISQMTRCSLLKACFTAVFPALVSHCFEKEEDFSSISKNEIKLINMVDILVTLVQVLLQQEMEQSTLDEIFTLLETWLKKEFVLSREMATKILSLTLKTFLENLEFKFGSPSSFSPGPYIIGSILPRCFDSSRQVQISALNCLVQTIEIMAIFEGHSKDNIQAMSSKMMPLIAMSPTHSSDTLNVVKVSRKIVEILTDVLQHEHLYPMVSSMIDSLSDRELSGARGTSLVITKILEVRGKELHAHTGDLVSRMYDKLLIIDEMEETRISILTSIRTLSTFNHKQVLKFLLSHPIDSSNKDLASIWKILTQNKALASDVLNELLREIQTDKLFNEDVDRIGDKVIRIARHDGLAAVVALGHMFEMKEMELACEGDFVSVFVPLLSTLVCYIGINTSEPLKKTPVKVKGNSAKTPFEMARTSLIAFLTCKGINSMARVAESFPDLSVEEQNPEKWLFELYQNFVIDFPQILCKLVRTLKPLLLANQLYGRNLTSLSFYVQMVQTETVLEHELVDASIEQLLSFIESGSSAEAENNLEEEVPEIFMNKRKEEKDLLTVMTFRGLSHFKIQDRNRDFSSRILVSLADSLGESFKSKVNQVACECLTQLIRNDSILEEDVHRLLSSLCNKLRTFFDCGNSEECQAAITAMSELSLFATDSYKDVYRDNVHCVMVSLLLHCNDENLAVCEASNEGVEKILKAITTEERQLPNSKELDYQRFLAEVFKCSDIQEMLAVYASSALTFFKSPKRDMRKNAVLLISEILLSTANKSEWPEEKDRVNICQGLSNLMLSDSEPEVQEIAALYLGKAMINSKLGTSSNRT